MMYYFDEQEERGGKQIRLILKTKEEVLGQIVLRLDEPDIAEIGMLLLNTPDKTAWASLLLQRAALHALLHEKKFLKIESAHMAPFEGVYQKEGFVKVAPSFFLKGLHPLESLMDLDHAARALGFVWEGPQMALEKVREETDEVALELAQSPYNIAALEAELGDLIFSTFSLGDFLGYEVSQVVLKGARKFASRMDAMRRVADENGAQSFKGQDAKTLLAWWAEARVRASAEASL
ncbi:MAG: hypothetical protein H2057_06870 [Alphaproteobacteria bacterium]|nr:hypothetical protein [Alphaproteobacteria bacterium]